jgi:hypothetical protein
MKTIPLHTPHSLSGILLIAVFLMALLQGCAEKQPAAQNSSAPEKNWKTEKLSKENSVLVLVDFLTGFDSAVNTIDTLTFYHNVNAFVKIGEIFKLPTVVLGDEGGFRGNFYPVIRKHAVQATYIERQTPSAWRVEAFRNYIAKTGRKKIILGGISLDNCVLQTSIDLIDNGYQVYVCADVSPAENEIVKQAALMRLEQAGAVIVTWGSIAGEIMGDWHTPEGEPVGKLYQDHSVYGGKLKPVSR